jgi:hypothetical protein
VAQHRTSRGLILAAILIVLTGVFVLSRDDQAQDLGTMLIILPTETATAAAPAGTPGPGGVSGSSALVMIQGLTERRLVLWSLHGEPLDIDRQSAWPLLASPDARYILYSTERAVMVLDRIARRAAIVGTLDEGSSLITAQWSPNSRAVAYVVQDALHRSAYYTLPDGSIPAKLLLQVAAGLPLDVAWLADGRAVTLSLGVGPVGGLETFAYAYDPVRQETVVLPPETPLIQPWRPWRSPDGQQQVYAVKTWDEARFKGTCGTGPLTIVGSGWLYSELLSSTTQTTGFELQGIYMDRPTWLHDGRILFRATADKTCTALTSGLYLGQAGQTPQLLAAAEPDYVSDQSDKLLWSTSYALSPDESLVAWTENDVEAGRGRVNLTPLDGGETQVLFETAAVTDQGPFAFQDREMILYFIWVP